MPPSSHGTVSSACSVIVESPIATDAIAPTTAMTKTLNLQTKRRFRNCILFRQGGRATHQLTRGGSIKLPMRPKPKWVLRSHRVALFLFYTSIRIRVFPFFSIRPWPVLRPELRAVGIQLFQEASKCIAAVLLLYYEYEHAFFKLFCLMR